MADFSVAIVILNWNGWFDTNECLRSLQKISTNGHRIFVVDNGSHGNDRENLKKIWGDRVKLILNSKNLGFAEGNNIGIKAALREGVEYVLLLNNDTIVDHNFLEELLHVAKSNSHVGICGAKSYFYNQPRTIAFGGGRINFYTGEAQHLNFKKHDTSDEEPQKVDFVEGSSMLIKKAVFDKIGFLDGNYFSYWEDVDFCWRANQADFYTYYVPKSKIWHKICSSTGGDQSVISVYYLVRNRIYFMKKYAKWYQKLFFLVYFILDSLRFFIMYKKISRIRSYCRGVWAGVWMN